MRSEFLPFAQPDIDEQELQAVHETIASGWLTTGPRTHQFEQAFAEAVGARHAIAVNSCTAAMHLALEAIGLQAEDEVITSPYTFAATAEVVRYFDARPVLIDVRPDDLNLDPQQLEQAMTERTRAVIPVHIAGLPAEMDEIVEIARRHDLRVIEDAAHAFPTTYKGRMIGALSDFTCFSFYATKTLTTGEGGMITTDDDQWAERCRIMALHGISKDAWKRYTAEGTWYYEIIAPGYKYNMTDVAAAMGLVQLGKAERMRERRCEIAQRYHAAFGRLPALQTPADRLDSTHAWHLYMLRVHLDQLTIDRAQFVEALNRHNIGASVHFIPLHLHPYYRDTYGYEPEDFPVAYREYQREISLPIYSRMSDDDVEDVIQAVSEIVTQHRVA
ncbi:MAG: DegT/DnrJ/EryC1/StrS aminotransferase family protein [Candidatus Promineifilaceae bacterium]|nr:DegT/DnrJ/EryC1/StrS aminotransferase family protein [Candidatus Promineifilaceae bacterium]